MKKNFKTGIIVLIVLIIIVAAISLFSILHTGNKDSAESFSFKGDYIALLKLEGTIEVSNETYNQKWLLENIDKFKNDKKNKAIALYINSPGGAVYQADQVYLALKDYQISGKKIYSYFGPMAASGGYYTGCAADEIWANRNTLTGSIGVIAGQSFDLTGLFENLGIKSETIHAGKNKNMMNYNEPFTEEQKEIMQSIADECYDQFCSIVASERKMDIDKVHELADGRVYTASQAKNNGLIDFIGNSENMLNKMKTDLEIPDARIITYEYEGKKSFKNLLLGKSKVSETSSIAAKLGIPEKVVQDMNQNSIYPAYLYK